MFREGNCRDGLANRIDHCLPVKVGLYQLPSSTYCSLSAFTPVVLLLLVAYQVDG